MADETPTGPGGEHIMGLGLDLSSYLSQLQQALEAYNVFSRQFSKTLSIQLDPQSMRGLSTAFGAQMRQALGVMRGEVRESAKESVSEAKKITDAVQGAFVKGFKDMPKSVREAREATISEIQKLAGSMEAVGTQIGQRTKRAVKKGTDAAKEQIAGVTEAAKKQADAQEALAQGKAIAARRLLQELAIAESKTGLSQQEIARRARIKDEIPTKTVGRGKAKETVVDEQATISQINKIRAAVAEMTGETATYLSRTERLWETAAARVDRLRREYEKLGETGKRMYAQLAAGKTAAEALEPQADQAMLGRTPYGQFRQAEDLTRRVIDDEGTKDENERQFLAERKYQAELAMIREAKQKELEIKREADRVEAKLLRDGLRNVDDKIKTEVAQYKMLAQQRNKLAKDIANAADAAEAKILRNAKKNIDEQIAESRAYYDHLKQQQKNAALAVVAQARLQSQQQTALTRATSAATTADNRLARITRSTGVSFQPIDPQSLLDKNGLIDRAALRELNQLTRKASAELTEYNQLLDERNKIIRENKRNEERINKALASVIRKNPERAGEFEARAAAMRQQLRPVPAAPVAGHHMVSAAATYGGVGTFTPRGPYIPHRIDTGPLTSPGGDGPDPKKYKAVLDLSKGVWDNQKGIGLSLSNTAVNMAKWLFFYKAVHEITRLIQTTIRSFVGAGIEYNKELETQTLALRGILAEHAEVIDSQGRQLHGYAALNALQGVAEQSWKRIQQSATEVVGTTADLMGLYTGILPFAAQLGADLETIHDLTRSTAVAARLLDVSFQDARSAMVALLQGRALTRNRLVGALGFRREEIQSLRGSDQLLGKIQERLDSFLLLTAESQQTFAAMSESFRDMTGIIASAFTEPAIDLFKRFMQLMVQSEDASRDASAGFALFKRTVDGFKMSPELASFLDFARNAMRDAIQPIIDFGKALSQTSQSDLQTWVTAVQQTVKWILEFGVAITKITLAFGTFIAENRKLIEALFWTTLLGGILNLLKLYFAWAQNAGQGSRIFQIALAALRGEMVTVTNAVTEQKTQVTAGAAAWSGLKNAMAGVVKGVGIAIFVTALFSIVNGLIRVREEADNAKEAIRALADQDINRLISAAHANLGSDNPKTRAQAGVDMALGAVDAATRARFGFYGVSPGERTTAFDAFARRTELETQRRERADQLTALAGDRSRLTSRSASLGRQILTLEQRIPGASAVEQDKFRQRIEALRAELNKTNTELESAKEKFNRLAEESAKLSAEAEKPMEAFRELGNVLNQEKVVRAAIEEIKTKGLTDSFKESFLPILDTVDPSGIARASIEKDKADFQALEDRLNKIFVNARLEFNQLVPVAEQWERAGQAEVRIKPPEREPTSARYVSQAEDLIDITTRNLREGLKRVDTQEALGEINTDEAIRLRQDYHKRILAIRVYYWEQERKHLEKHIAQEQKDDKENFDKKKEQYENQRRDISKNILQAQEDQRNQAYDDEKELGIYGQHVKEVLGDIARDLAKAQADIYGSVEDEALASFDDTIKQIEDKIAKIESFDDVTRRQASSLLAGFRGIRSDLGQKARNESVIKTTGQQLETSRQQEDLLTQQFQAGTVNAEVYLQSIRRIRAEQASLLEQQAKALELEAERRRSILGVTTAMNLFLTGSSGKTPEALAGALAEITAFEVRAKAARAAIDDIHSSARKVEAALQAWSTLTGQVREFLAAADGLDGTRTGIESITRALQGTLGVLDRIIASSVAFARLPKAFEVFKGLFTDANGKSGLGSSFSALGGLFSGGAKALGGFLANTFTGGRYGQNQAIGQALGAGVTIASGIGSGPAGAVSAAQATGTMTSAGSKFMAAIPAIGIGVSAALAIGTAFFNRAVEKAKKDIGKSFENISKGLASGALTLGQAITQAEQERKRLVERYSRSKSGRKALRELLPQIDDQIEQMRQRAKEIQKSFEEAFKQMVDAGGNTIKPGPFQDFMRELMALEKFVREYLDSVAMNTNAGVLQMAEALAKVDRYVQAFFENAKLQFGEQLLGFEAEALGAQERLFQMINSQDGYYKQLRDIAEERLDLEEQVQDEMERRQEAQNKLNDLAEKEAEIRKRIADIIRQAAEDEMAIRRRGVLEAQLSVAQQKATEISNVRYRAQEEIDRLRKELAGLQDDIEDQTKENQRRDRDFFRRRRSLDEREQDIRKEMRLNDIRIRGAQAVAEIQGQIFGMAANEFELAERQNEIAQKQAEIQVAKWRETKALFDAIIKGADGFFFDPPEGFPQIKVELGTITIDNRDQSTNTFNNEGRGPRGPEPRPDPPGRREPRRIPTASESEAYNIGSHARTQGFGDVY